jgi:hypothetical protein
MIFMRSENFNGRMQRELLWFVIAMLVVVNQSINQENAGLKSAPGPDTL